MKVELISYTGHGHSDPLYAARLLIYTKATRLEQSADTRNQIALMDDEEILKELDYIAKSIRSSWEFIDYTFQITGVTRAFTHQLVRTRTGSYAQQSQRSVDMSGFEYVTPESIKGVQAAQYVWDRTMDDINNGYQQMVELFDIPPQDARGLLPTNVCTNIIAKFNLRTLADILQKRKNLRAQGEYADVARAMGEEVLKVHPWAETFINPERLKTPALDALLKAALGDRAPAQVPEINNALKELDMLKGTWG